MGRQVRGSCRDGRRLDRIDQPEAGLTFIFRRSPYEHPTPGAKACRGLQSAHARRVCGASRCVHLHVGERSALPLSWWESRLAAPATAGQVVFGTLQGDRLRGAAGLSFETREKARHKATLFGMYVPAAQRGQGLGKRLVSAALKYARSRPGVRLVQLTVTEGNAAAEALYAHCGFVAFGVEPMAVPVVAGTASLRGASGYLAACTPMRLPSVSVKIPMWPMQSLISVFPSITMPPAASTRLNTTSTSGLASR